MVSERHSWSPAGRFGCGNPEYYVEWVCGLVAGGSLPDVRYIVWLQPTLDAHPAGQKVAYRLTTVQPHRRLGDIKSDAAIETLMRLREL